MQRIESDKLTTIHDLRPGDIFFFNFAGVPHTGIYAPSPGKQGDIIHMYFDKTRAGAIKSTLSKILLSGKEIYIFRNKNLDGNAIAEQAECWLNQGVEYSKSRLAESIYPYSDEKKSEEYNILKYLLIAARRETMPIKVHQFPYHPDSNITNIGIVMLLPDYTYCRPLSYLGAKLAQYDTSDPDRPKGMTCVAFVLSCLAAIALKDEIKPVSAETGWASIKHSDKYPGVQHVLTDDELINFDYDRLRHKLTPAIAKLDPHKPSPYEFYDAVRNDESNWEFIGTVDKTIVKKFDREAYRQEQAELEAAIKINRQKFLDTFGEEIFNRNPERQHRQFSIFNGTQQESVQASQNTQDIQHQSAEASRSLSLD
ncbi:MAG TPA: hypothetical protein VL360_03110 [Gammaproteobacteria bacterium]|jgi:hypothetical protein|nr:hypothetical protein [Gammaproteobacteria bacterium]